MTVTNYILLCGVSYRHSNPLWIKVRLHYATGRHDANSIGNTPGRGFKSSIASARAEATTTKCNPLGQTGRSLLCSLLAAASVSKQEITFLSNP